jgi:nucleoside-diphosphate-sugar epimerase
MKYVITGARGYIARALAKSLATQGHILRLVSRSAVVSSCDRSGAIVEHVQADLRKEESWLTLLEGAEAIIHLSARTDLKAAEADPAADHVLNVEPVRALVRAAERCGTAISVIFASSTSIVGDSHVNPVNEATPDCPCSVYDRHKLECEMILRDATRRGVLRACSLRLATVFGYGDRIGSINANRGVLNAMIRRAIDGQPLTLYGDGSPVRDFTHVDDVCSAFQLAVAEPDICDGRHYIIATGHGHTLAEAFRCVAREAYCVTGREVEICHVPEPPNLHPIERSNFIGDASAFQKLTHWRAKVDLQSGIRHYFQRLVAAQLAGA